MRLKEWKSPFCPFCTTVNHVGVLARNEEENTFHCWSCGASGNQVVFFAMMEGVTVEEIKAAVVTLMKTRT